MINANFTFVKHNTQIITRFNELKKRIRAEKKLPIEQRNTWVGFIPYDTGAKWQGIQSTKATAIHHNSLPEVYFLPYQVKSVPGHTKVQSDFDDVNFVRTHKPRLEHSSFRLSKTEPVRSNLSKSAYIKKIQKIKEYLRSGDTYQVNFSQRFSTNFEGDPLSLFLALSQKNPSPHEFFMDTPEFSIISNSPERLVRGYRKDGRFMIETRPMKGTVPRGLTPKEDARNIEKLLQSPKEKAELAMITDLSRNDLGKICVPGTVCVTENRTVEKYSHVIHTVSNIEGELSHGRDVFDVLESLFPGGSITGCPKKRTMEIIAKLEDSPRGVYCGSAGVIYPDGSFDFNIMIRTAFIDKFPLTQFDNLQKPLSSRVLENTNPQQNFDNVKFRPGTESSGLPGQTSNLPWLLTFSAGGGIVIDSNPEREYEETLHKAQAFLEVLR